MDDWARLRRYKIGDQIEKVQDNFKNGTSQRKIGIHNFKNGASDLFTRGLG